MYGLVNKAAQDLITKKFGPDTWDMVRKNAELDTKEFVSLSPYPDHITYRVVGEASKVTGLGADEILQAFGEYWILFSAQEGYGELLDMCGDTLVGFLQNLDDLHARISMAMPELKPPSIECSDMSDSSLRVHYRSSREGLAPFVVGLLTGLGKRFDTEVAVRHEATKDVHGHDVFFVKYLGKNQEV